MLLLTAAYVESVLLKIIMWNSFIHLERTTIFQWFVVIVKKEIISQFTQSLSLVVYIDIKKH